jgi:hypothetical protein
MQRSLNYFFETLLIFSRAPPPHLPSKKKIPNRYGIRGLLIDPYNELDHQRHSSMSETEYVSQMLTKIKRFAQHNDVHVWFVAHPKQLQQWKGDAPNLYDISGSAHFVNKADAGVVVHRVRNENGPNDKVSTGGWGTRRVRGLRFSAFSTGPGRPTTHAYKTWAVWNNSSSLSPLPSSPLLA